MSSVLENHMLIGRAIPVEEASGTFNEYFRLDTRNYAQSCHDWLYRQVPKSIKTVNDAFAWLVDPTWLFLASSGEPATEAELRESLCNAILHAGDMGHSGIDPSDCGEGDFADAVCEAILKNKQRVYR